MKQESAIQEDLAALFDGGAARGAFATHWRGTAADLHVEVTGVGPLRFPISQATVRKLRSVARPARFGKGEGAGVVRPRPRGPRVARSVARGVRRRHAPRPRVCTDPLGC